MYIKYGLFYFKEANSLYPDGALKIHTYASSLFSRGTDGTFLFVPHANVADCPILKMIISLHVRGHVGWVNSDTLGKLPCVGPWHYYFIIFSSSRKQMGLPDTDFYLLFLSKVPQGFLTFPKAGHWSPVMERSTQHLQTFCGKLLFVSTSCFLVIYISGNQRDAYLFLSQ